MARESKPVTEKIDFVSYKIHLKGHPVALYDLGEDGKGFPFRVKSFPFKEKSFPFTVKKFSLTGKKFSLKSEKIPFTVKVFPHW